MPSKFSSPHQKRTNPLIWCLAIICAALAVAVIIAGIVVSVGYVVIHPRVPFISVSGAHLDVLQYDHAGVLETQISIMLHAENDNQRAHATFSDTRFKLSYDGIGITYLAIENSFDVKKNKSRDFKFQVESRPILLGDDQMKNIDWSLKRDVIVFDLKGSSKAQWKIGLLGSVKFWLHLNCYLRFHPSNQSYIYSSCSSRNK